MKSPDEIKRELDNPIHVHYHISDIEPRLTPLALHDLEFIHTDAIAYIQQLEAQNAKKDARIQQLEAERDAAVRDCGCFPCQTCEERENGDLCPMCEIHGGFRKFHQWRGVQKEERNPYAYDARKFV